MTYRHTLLPILMTSLLVCVQPAGSEDGKSSVTTWQDAARKSGLSTESISELEKNRILITNDAYKQVFSAYLSGNNPFFITSDSLLNAYHVLYEESILRLENSLAARLPGILQLILKNIENTDDHLKGNPALVSAAKKRAKLVTGIALKLMDDYFQLQDDELNQIMKQEVKRIVKAKDVTMPDWLGIPDESFIALDYSRYTPRGFYTRSERLKGYFRAVSWLQSIPFRLNEDVELLSILMLGNSVAYERFDNSAERREMESFFRAYRLFIGAGDDWDLMSAAHEAGNDLNLDLKRGHLQYKRARLMKMAKGYGAMPQINDQIRLPPGNPLEVAEPNFRVISAYRTPSAMLFQRTTDFRKFDRPYPDGLEVAISLGSAFARKNLQDSRKVDLLKTIDSCQSFFQGSSLYFEYLDALKTLLDKPEPDAPEFMKSEIWQAKSCNTVLAGWAQLRHTWVLQAKQTVYYACETTLPEGFVEPEPEFFGRMADLAGTTLRRLNQAGVFNSDFSGAIVGLEMLLSILNGVNDESDLRDKIFKLTKEDRLAMKLPLMLMEMNAPEAERGSENSLMEQRQWVETLLADIKNGRTDKYPELKGALEEYNFDLEDLWQQFEKVSRRLEAIAHKQLRHVDLNKREVALIKRYGVTIAGIMLYGGNSYLTPRDDAPRVVDVYANPNKPVKGYLHIGIARPRKMYVLYPWEGKTVLCEGAVLPYYEFVDTSRLIDESWKARLDSDKRPSIPKWMSPLVSGSNLSKPILKEEH